MHFTNKVVAQYKNQEVRLEFWIMVCAMYF